MLLCWSICVILMVIVEGSVDQFHTICPLILYTSLSSPLESSSLLWCVHSIHRLWLLKWNDLNLIIMSVLCSKWRFPRLLIHWPNWHLSGGSETITFPYSCGLYKPSLRQRIMWQMQSLRITIIWTENGAQCCLPQYVFMLMHVCLFHLFSTWILQFNDFCKLCSDTFAK